MLKTLWELVIILAYLNLDRQATKADSGGMGFFQRTNK